MSGSNSVTVAAPPTTAESTAIALATLAAASGVITDFNKGSQVRSFFESFAEVIEEQGIINEALAYQAIIYSAYQAFDISPLSATAATGSVTFSTGAAVASQDITIGAGTIVQTVGGIQYQTTSAVTIPSGSSSVTATIEAINAGSSGNVSAGSVSIITTTQAFYLTVTNPAAITNGSDAETPAQTFARFTAVVAALGQASPVSIANACIGVTADSGAEVVRYANVYEPWITSMANPLPVGFQVYIDDGSGTASADLITAATTVLMGNAAENMSGYHPAGVPFTVNSGTPVTSTVTVTATLTDSTLEASLQAAVTTAVNNYYSTLGYAATCEVIQIIAAVANVLSGYVTSLDVILYNSSSTSVQSITATYAQRVILSGLTLDF
jgi:uncharacterized phage protein gp47/JayE